MNSRCPLFRLRHCEAVVLKGLFIFRKDCIKYERLVYIFPAIVVGLIVIHLNDGLSMNYVLRRILSSRHCDHCVVLIYYEANMNLFLISYPTSSLCKYSVLDELRSASFDSSTYALIHLQLLSNFFSLQQHKMKYEIIKWKINYSHSI